MRPVIYPRAEELIRNKRQAKLDEQTGEEANRGGPSSGRRAGNTLTLKFYITNY
jgi:hypothetical protein